MLTSLNMGEASVRHVMIYQLQPQLLGQINEEAHSRLWHYFWGEMRDYIEEQVTNHIYEVLEESLSAD